LLTQYLEYICQIRSCIVNGKARDVDALRKTSQDSYFNSVKFWQEAYEKSEEAKSQLLDKIYDLEQQKEALLARTKPWKYGNKAGMPSNTVLDTPRSGNVSPRQINGIKDKFMTTNNNKETRQLLGPRVSADLNLDTIDQPRTRKRKRDRSPCETNHEDTCKHEVYLCSIPTSMS
jgi:hypothetical protein